MDRIQLYIMVLLSAVYANQNVNKAYTYGFNANVKLILQNSFHSLDTATYTYGRFKNPNGTKIPLDHIPPVFGKGSV